MAQAPLPNAPQQDKQTPSGGASTGPGSAGLSLIPVNPAASSTEAWQATLAYWLECGVEFRAGDRLEFFTPPPRSRATQEIPKLPALPDPPPPNPRPVAAMAVPPRVKVSPPRPIEGVDLPWSPPIPAIERPPLLAQMAEEVGHCSRCALAKTRTQAVFGVGDANAEVVFVGEGPGADEDRQGEPFVGVAGQLLDKMFYAIGLQRSQVYIANVVKCRPPGNRNPHPEEMAACQEYLFRQLATIRPKVIFCLGKFAILCLTGHARAIGQARGKAFFWRGIPVIASYHPAYYLRTPRQKRAAWVDLIRLKKQLHLLQQEQPQQDD